MKMTIMFEMPSTEFFIDFMEEQKCFTGESHYQIIVCDGKNSKFKASISKDGNYISLIPTVKNRDALVIHRKAFLEDFRHKKIRIISNLQI